MFVIWKRRSGNRNYTLVECYIRIFGLKVLAWKVHEHHLEFENVK